MSSPETFGPDWLAPPADDRVIEEYARGRESSANLQTTSRPESPPVPWSYGLSLRLFLGDEEPSDDDTDDYIIRGQVARGVPGLLAGDPKVGKTMLAEDWAVCIASGASEWCGFPIPRRVRVLLMPREDSERTTKIRIWQIARGHGIDPRDLDGWLSVDPVNPLDMANGEHVGKLREAMRTYELVIVDSFTTAHHGDENSARDIANVMGTARDLCAETKSALVFLHHFNGKGSAADARSVKHRLRGSSALAGYARHIVGASLTKDGLVEISSDGNLAYKPEPFVVELESLTRGDGKRTLRYVNRGAQSDIARAAKNRRVDSAIRLALVESGILGLGTREIRQQANAILKEDGGSGVRPVLIDQRTEALIEIGDAERAPDGRVRIVSRGVSK